MFKVIKSNPLCAALVLGCTMSFTIPTHANLQSQFYFLGKKTCMDSLGSLSISVPKDATAWTMIGLSVPTRMLQVFVNDSKCFTVVDRGTGFSAAQQERQLAEAGHLRTGQNIGAGQMRVADYVLIPEIVSQNLNAGGSSYGVSGSGERGFLGSIANVATLGVAGRLSGSGQKKTAEVVLTLVDVRTSEQVASVSAEAKVTDRAISAAIAANQNKTAGQLHYSSWNNTQIGKVIQEAYKEAFDNLLVEVDRKGLLWRQTGASSNFSQPMPVPVPATSSLAPAPQPLPVKATPAITQPANVAVQTVTTTQAATANQSTAPKVDLSALTTKSSLSLKRVARLLSVAHSTGNTVTELQPGMLVYPTGESEGNMLRVEDEMGNKGWIPSVAVAQ